MKQTIFFVVTAKPESKANEKARNPITGQYYKGKKYQDFEDMVGWEAKKSLPKNFKLFTKPGLSVIINCFFTNRKNAIDVANIPKSITDALQGIVYDNDNKPDCLIVRREFGYKNSHFSVEVSGEL